MSHPALQPGRLGPLTLRNRLIKTATYEGMTPDGQVGEALIRFHAGIARSGVALTTVAYGAVHPDGRTFPDQLLVGERTREGLARLAAAVHQEGGLVSLQLAHCGGFSRNPDVSGGGPPGPSAGWNLYGVTEGIPRVRAMTQADLAETVAAFAAAARTAREAGFDAVEVHVGHGYLLSQFLSPHFNRRTDAHGGSLEGRVRLAVEVVRATRAAVGDTMAVLVKLNTTDGLPGGLTLDDAVEAARHLAEAGAHAIVPSGGLVQRTPFFLMRGEVPVREMVAVETSALQRWTLRLAAPIFLRPVPWTPTFFLTEALRMQAAVPIPIVLLGGVDSAASMARALEAGLPFVALGRSLLADPDLVDRLRAGEAFVSRCTHCNRCVAEMDRDGVRCVL